MSLPISPAAGTAAEGDIVRFASWPDRAPQRVRALTAIPVRAGLGIPGRPASRG